MRVNTDFAVKVVTYFNTTECTTRECGEYFGISNSTVHRYLTEVLPNPTSREILDANKARSLFGGGYK